MPKLETKAELFESGTHDQILLRRSAGSRLKLPEARRNQASPALR